MTAAATIWLDQAVLLLALAIALLFKPWLPLRQGPLATAWLGAMVLLPFAWWTRQLLPAELPLHPSGACLLVLMFGWPLAIWSLIPVGLAAQYLTTHAWPELGVMVSHVVWHGVIPATLALGAGLAMRRWLPKHLFVYILGRGFIATALAISATGYLAALAGQRPATTALDEWMLAHWLLGWGEAVSTGMLTAIFVAFKPHWLLTYSDARYLPREASPRDVDKP